MKYKTCVRLSLIATILRAVSLLVVFLLSALQEQILDSEGLPHVVPWNTVVTYSISLLLAYISWIVIRRQPDRRGTIAVTICMVALHLVVFNVISGLTSLNFIDNYLDTRGKTMVYNDLVPYLNTTVVLNAPAYALLLLSLGGICGRSFKEFEPLETAVAIPGSLSSYVECPYCHTRIKERAVRCPNCKMLLADTASADP